MILMDNPAKNFRKSIQNFRRLFDLTPAQVALIDFTGVILATNSAWQQFGRENELSDSYQCVGQNYLTVCETAAASGNADVTQICVGLLQVIHLRRSKFTTTYPCHSPTERKWCRLWIEPQLPEMPVIVVAHYPCTSRPIFKKFQQPSSSSISGERSGYNSCGICRTGRLYD
jgi:hypothetical protein